MNGTEQRSWHQATAAGWPWWPDLELARPADAGALVACALAAVGTDLAVRSGIAGVGGTLLVSAVAAGLILTGRAATPQARAVVATAPVFGVWLLLRSSPWLLPLDVLAAGGLLVLGASLSADGSPFDLSVPNLVNRALHALGHGLRAPGFLARSPRPAEASVASGLAVVRGVGLALPLLVVLGLLLASADPVFAGFFRFWNPVSAIGHAVLLVLGAWGMAGLLRTASAARIAPLPAVARRLGTVEADIALGSLVALFTAFAAAQVVALSAGGRHVIETAGLTYAEYARSGFFQLLAVAVITLAVVAGLPALTAPRTPATRLRFVVLAEAVVVLTLVIVVVALRRLALYEDAYGLTMLRLFSQVFAWWLAVVFLLLGLRLAGVGGGSHWFAPAALAAGLVALLVLGAVNPEGLVVRRNVDRAAAGGRFDAAYLAGLSDDAVPALVRSLPRLDPTARQAALEAVCRPRATPFRGWAAFNLARARAAAARDQVCPRPS